MIPLPHQLVGAAFLSARPRALLADSPRVGKTGAAITACDDLFARRVLVITTASGRAVWAKAWRDWSMFDFPVTVVDGRKAVAFAGRTIVGWAGLPQLAPALSAIEWDVIILDEGHYAKAWSAQRAQAIYGVQGADECLASHGRHVWSLTGTPIPNAADDLHPMLYRLAPERLAADPARGWPDVTAYDDFLARYCVTRPKRLSRWTTVSVVVGSCNLDELHARLEGFWLRRTQADVGIVEPIYETLPILISEKDRRAFEADLPEIAELFDSIETGERLDWHLGVLRRRTGGIKAAGVAQAVRDEMAGGLDKIVLMAWHTEVLDTLERELASFGVVRVDGSTPPAKRAAAEEAFRSKAKPRVFLGNIIACREATDLSAAADLIFVEASFVPKDMAQAAQRIVNLNQSRQPRVRVAALAGSIDEAIATVLTRKVRDIQEILAK